MYSAVYYADDEEAATWPSVSTLSIPFHILPFITGTQAILNPTFAVTLPDPCPPRYSHAVNHNKIFWRNCPSGPKWRCTFQMEFLFLSFFVGIQSNFSFVYSSFVTEKHKRDNSLCVATFWNAMQTHKVHFVFVFSVSECCYPFPSWIYVGDFPFSWSTSSHRPGIAKWRSGGPLEKQHAINRQWTEGNHPAHTGRPDESWQCHKAPAIVRTSFRHNAKTSIAISTLP